MEVSQPAPGFWQAVGAALSALARTAGCSFAHHPLPELREVAHDIRQPPQGRAPASGPGRSEATGPGRAAVRR
jgi:hypothetical protein